ncbi:MAG: A24 family peptidase [Hyphomicrobium sp.]|jgi:prepilin signal peptidase PulO-like enzyme (type II secretory pathway)
MASAGTGTDDNLSKTRQIGLTLACGALYGVIALPALWQNNLSRPDLMMALLLGCVLASLSAIDVITYRLPDVLTMPLALAGLAACAYFSPEDVAWRGLAALVGFAMLYAVSAFYRSRRGKDGLGLGDAKLFAATGAWVGLDGLPSVLLVASATALTGAVAAMLVGFHVRGETRIPFGPFIALGTWLVWLYGPFI